jgi:hypothetical protein
LCPSGGLSPCRCITSCRWVKPPLADLQVLYTLLGRYQMCSGRSRLLVGVHHGRGSPSAHHNTTLLLHEHHGMHRTMLWNQLIPRSLCIVWCIVLLHTQGMRTSGMSWLRTWGQSRPSSPQTDRQATGSSKGPHGSRYHPNPAAAGGGAAAAAAAATGSRLGTRGFKVTAAASTSGPGTHAAKAPAAAAAAAASRNTSWMGGVKVTASAHASRLRALRCWVWWLYAGFVVPLLRANFYVTESEPYRQHVFYYR